MKKLLILVILLGFVGSKVYASEYNTLSVSNYTNYMNQTLPYVEIFKYDDKAPLPYYDSHIYDAGCGYKVIVTKGYPYEIYVLKFKDNKLLWIKTFNTYKTIFKTSKSDKNGNLTIELENYSKKDVFDFINNRGKKFNASDFYLTKKDFTINENGSIINELKGFKNEYEQFIHCDSFDYNGKHYYIVGEQIYYIGEDILWINYYLLGFDDENGDMILKDAKYLFSQKTIDDITIDASDKVNIGFGNKKMTLKGNKLSFNNLESFCAHLYGSLRHALSIYDVKKKLNIYKNETINNQGFGYNSKLIGELSKIQKSGFNTILVTRKVGGFNSYNSIIRIDNHNKIFTKTIDDYKLSRDIDSISYKNGVYRIKLKETPEYKYNLYLNNVINVKEDGTIINPLKIIEMSDPSRNQIKRFIKDGNSFLMSNFKLYLLKDDQVYSTELSYNENEQDIKIIDNENYQLKYLKLERKIKDYNYYTNGYNPEKERECDFKFSDGSKFWIKRNSLLWRPFNSDKTYHLGSLFPRSLSLPEDFKITSINVSDNDSIVEINTSLGKVIFMPQEEKIISPEIVVKKKLVKIDKPVSIVKKLWKNSELNINKDVYYFQSSELNIQ